MILKIFEHRSKIFLFIFIVAIAFLQRGATLFVDFYDVDELNDVIMIAEMIDGGEAGVDALISRPVYFIFFYTIFKFFGTGNFFALHFATILWIIATCFVLYLINKELFSEKAGLLAAFFYVVFVSGFFEYYLAVHGEIILNLPLMLSLYFFVLAEKGNRIIFNYILSGLFIFISFLAKGHGLVLIPFYILYFLFLKPYVTKSKSPIGSGVKILVYFVGGMVLIAIVSITFSFTILGFDLIDYIKVYFFGNLKYALEGFASLDFFQVVKKKCFFW